MTSKPHIAFTRRYKCMYTRDINKKAKAWQDGYLVFHHLNAKLVLMSDQFVVLDECFYRPPGIHNLRDIPKSYKIPLETNATFDKHVATVEEAVFEEEKDISELFQKKRKEIIDLDEFLGSDDEGETPKYKRARPSAQPEASTSHTPSGARAGWLYRVSTGSTRPASPAAPSATNGPTPAKTGNTRGNFSSPGFNKVQHVNRIAQSSEVASPKASTPFKPPSFVGNSQGASPSIQRPSSVPRRTLGSTRPSSMLARQTLQAEWAKYADLTPMSASKSRPCSNKTKIVVPTTRERDESRATRLAEIRKQDEPAFVQVDQQRRDGEAGDPIDWLFD